MCLLFIFQLMLTTSLLNEFEQAIVSKGENAFYNPSDNYYKRKNKLTQLINLLDNNKLLNKEGLHIIENIPSDKFENYIMGKLINVIPTTINKEVINDVSNHVSSLSQTIADYHKDNAFANILYKSCHEVNLDNEEENGEFRQIKETIHEFKKAGKDYQLFIGHMLEDIIGLHMAEYYKGTNKNKHKGNKLKQLTDMLSTINENNWPKLSESILLGSNTLGPDQYYIVSALVATINEVKTKDKDTNTLHNMLAFVEDILTNEQLLTTWVKYVRYLRMQVNTMLDDVLSNTKTFKFITKHRVDYRGVYGETDYIINCLKGGSSVLADCKVYDVITPEIMNKFVFQLVGYYHQHTLLKTTPRYYDKNSFNIGRLMIVNPLDANYKFSYYIVNIQDYKHEFDNMLNIWDEYITKCLNCSKFFNESR